MAITITVYPYESPRLVVIPSPQYDVSIQEVYNAIRAWEDSQIGMLYDYLINASGKEVLGDGKYVGVTLQLQNTQLQFLPVNTVHTTGTVTTDDTLGEHVHDSGATFTGDNIHVGDTVFNSTTGAMGTAMEVVDNNTLRLAAYYLQGGTRQTWLIGDGYTVYHNQACSITGGNLTAVDSLGADLDPVLPSANCFVRVENATSAALIESTASVTQADLDNIADAVWDDVDAKLIVKAIKNKKSLEKSGSVWELIIYDDDDVTPILNKALKDSSGDDITDLVAGTLAQEIASSV